VPVHEVDGIELAAVAEFDNAGGVTLALQNGVRRN
jgi:hypothetical protein